MAIVAGVVLTRFDPALHDQLQGAARVVAADLAAARELAITNNTSYKLTFEPASNRYYLEHSGTNSALDSLPETGFGLATDPATRRTTDFARLPFGASQLRLHGVHEWDSEAAMMPTEVTTLEFGSLGQTTRSQPTWIWLVAGQDSSGRYLPLKVDPVTGLVSIEALQAYAPTTPDDDLEATPVDSEPISYDFDDDAGTGADTGTDSKTDSGYGDRVDYGGGSL